MDNTSADKLFEVFTLHKILVGPYRPFEYYRGRLIHNFWNHVRFGRKDTAYVNANNQYHRLYGPAYISENYDIEAWYKDGVLHRADGGPAYRHKGSYYWLRDAKLHRLDGPAVDAVGHPKEYWIDGCRWAPKHYKREIARRHRTGTL